MHSRFFYFTANIAKHIDKYSYIKYNIIAIA